MKTTLAAFWGGACVALLLLAAPAQAAEATKISDVAHSVFFRGGSGTRGAAGTNGGHYTDRYFNGNFTDYTYCNGSGTTELVVDVSHIVTDPDGQAYVTDVLIGHQGNAQYSLYYTNEPEPENLETYATDPRTWTPIAGADHVQEAGTKTYGVNDFATAVKYVFNTCPNWTTHLAEIEVQGYEYVPPKAVKISAVGRSVFFRGGSGTRGAAGTNGGHYTDRYFNGDFTDYTYCNGSGTTELVIPTTGLDDQGTDTGVAWYVTDFKVGHQGNAQYSLYYTTEAEPANLETYASDPRTWTLIAGADHVQEAGTKTFGVNAFATAVKYVFNTCPNWTTHLAEVEVWAMDPSSITCLHPNMTDDSPAWTVCTAPTCTENGFEERFCPDCGARFEREVPLSKLGHDFVATLTTPGSATAYGSGYVECSRCNEFHIVFNGDTVDLTTLGGPPINGVVQYTDLTVSSTGAEDGGVKPIYLMDGDWSDGWGHAWYAGTRSHDEYVQFAFGTTIELTKIEYSVLNQYQTVDFYKYDPTNGVETLLRSIPIKKDETSGAPGYQRKTVMFFGEGENEHVFVDAIRMRIGDYVDPDTGETTAYIGYNYGRPYHTIVCEVHPHGTIVGAGMTGTPVAMIGDDSYMSLAAAIAAVTNDTATTIVLEKSTAEDVVIPAGRNITLNLFGNSITNDASDTITVYGTLTLQDAAGHGEVVALGEGNAAVLSTNSVAIASGTYRGGIEGVDDGTFIISGGWFDAPVPVEYAATGKVPTTVPENGLYTVKIARTVTFNLGAEADNAVYTNLVVATGEPVAEPEDPTLEGYTFNEWRLNDVAYDFTNTLVTANITLVANWTTNQYDVLWMSDGTLFASNRLDYGAAVVEPDPAPDKAADAQYTYWFAGWDPAPDATVSSNATYTAVFTNTVNQYAVAFEWHDGAMTNEYAYGTAAADVAVPRDPPTYVENGTIYTFTGWSAAVADVTGAAIYTAQYSSATAVAEVLEITNDGATTNSVGTFASLRAALSDAPAGSTIVLLADDSVSFSATDPEIGVNKAITIDGDGHTLYGLDDYAGGSGDHDIYVSGSGDVTIKNITLAEFGGAVPVTGRTYPIWTGSAYAGTLTLDHVTVTNFNRTAFNLNGGTVVVRNCTITGDMTKGFQGGVFQEGIGVYNADVTVENTTITGAGSTYEKEDSQIAACIQLGNPNGPTPGTGSITVKSGTFSGEYGLIVASNAMNAVTVESGTFTGALLVEDGEGGSIAVSGGTFDAPVPAEYCADGFAPTTVAEDGKYTVKTACTVTFKTDDETVYTNAVVAAGETVAEPPAPTKEDFTFLAWQENGADFDFATAITNDLVLVASWEAVATEEPEPVDLSTETYSDDEIAAGAIPAGVVTDETSGETEFVVCFHGQAGMTYTLQGSTTLNPADWKSEALVVGTPVTCTVDGQLVRLEFPMDANAPSAMFFKIGASRTPAAGE